MIIAEKWRAVADEPTDEDTLRVFVAQKLGGLQAQFLELIATLNFLVPVAPDRSLVRIRRLLYFLIVLVIGSYVLLGLHVAWTAGWLGS